MGVNIKPDAGYMSQAEKNRISAEYDAQVLHGTPGYFATPGTALAAKIAAMPKPEPVSRCAVWINGEPCIRLDLHPVAGPHRTSTAGA